MKKLEALNPFSGEEGFVHRGVRFETSEARANLLLRAGLVKELPADTDITQPVKKEAEVIGKPKAAEPKAAAKIVSTKSVA
jgi:hypothetical protein